MPLCQIILTALTVASSVLAAPGLKPRQGDAVPGKYIISLKPGVQMAQHLSWATQVHARSPRRREEVDTGVSHEYSIRDFSAYAAAFDDATIEQIRNSDDVRSHHLPSFTVLPGAAR